MNFCCCPANQPAPAVSCGYRLHNQKLSGGTVIFNKHLLLTCLPSTALLQSVNVTTTFLCCPKIVINLHLINSMWLMSLMALLTVSSMELKLSWSRFTPLQNEKGLPSEQTAAKPSFMWLLLERWWTICTDWHRSIFNKGFAEVTDTCENKLLTDLLSYVSN